MAITRKRDKSVCVKVIDTVMADASNSLDRVREMDHKVSPV